MDSVTILCTDPGHPVNGRLVEWARLQAHRADIVILRDSSEVVGGDFLFLVSCHQIITAAVRRKFKFTLVLHASALPHGRGMSPQVWQVLEGADHLTVTLLNAEDQLDSGDIWQQIRVNLDGTELCDELNSKLFEAEIGLMTWALDNCRQAKPRAQSGTPSFYRKRVPADSALDPQRPLADQFNLLRVADPVRYPAHFWLNGQKYEISIRKAAP